MVSISEWKVTPGAARPAEDSVHRSGTDSEFPLLWRGSLPDRMNLAGRQIVKSLPCSAGPIDKDLVHSIRSSQAKVQT